jgi:hypothetical protein
MEEECPGGHPQKAFTAVVIGEYQTKNKLT